VFDNCEAVDIECEGRGRGKQQGANVRYGHYLRICFSVRGACCGAGAGVGWAGAVVVVDRGACD
jgi:hypothetical protein